MLNASRCFKLIFLTVLFLGLMAGASFALPSGTPLTFGDTVYNPANPYKWTHTLENTDFTPPLDVTDTYKVKDAGLDIKMDLKLGSFMGFGLSLITSTGDDYFLENLIVTGTPGATINDYLWSIDLSANLSALNAITDKTLTVLLQINPTFGGSINSVDYSRLSGDAIVAPEPGTLLLLGSGLLVLSLYGRKRMKKQNRKEV